MAQDANALVLEISRQDSRLSMSIFKKEELASTVRHYSEVSLSLDGINRLCQEIIFILNKVNKEGSLEPDLIKGLEKSGQLLWDQLLSRAVKDTLNNTQIQDLVLSLDERLIHIPWELLYTGREFLCLKFNLGRLVRTKERTSPPQYRSLASRQKMLILADPTAELKCAYTEGISIKNQFERKRSEIGIDFKSTRIDTLYVKKNFRDYDIVHFAGHSEYDSEDPQNSGWVLSDGRFSVQDIIALGETLSLPTLVFSNACQSASILSSLIEQDYQSKTYSLAGAFLFSGVRLYIGTIRKIEDQMSLVFAREFYNQLISGKSVGECIRLSRLRLIKEYGIGAISWVSFILYGDPSFVLFKVKAKTRPLTSRRIFLSKKQMALVCLIIAIISVCIYLYMWLPTLNPSTYALFLKSRRLFWEGANNEAVAISSRIIEREPAFLGAYPLLADAYHKLGKVELALKCYFEYIRQSEKANDKKNLANAYTGIGWIYQLQGDYPKAFDFYHKALSLSEENKDILNKATVLRRLAEWHIDKKEYNLALELLTKSSEINRTRQYIYGHRYNLACDYFDLGLVFINKDDFPAAREFYGKSRILFERLNLENELSDCYFNIGEVYLFQKQYQRALEHYLQGLSIDQAHDNKLNMASDYIMIGELYMEMDNPARAEEFFNESVSVSKEINAPVELASAYYNLGLLYKKKGQKNRAREYFRFAQEIYRNMQTSDYEKVKEELLGLTNTDRP